MADLHLLDTRQRAELAKFLANRPDAVFVPFDKVALGALRGRPPTDGPFWTVSAAGSLMTAGGRK